MSVNLEIKKLGAREIEAAKELFRLFQLDDGVENPTSASDEYLKKLLEKQDFHVLVAVENQKVIGGLTAYELLKYKKETSEMFLYEIGVAAAHRKKGAASALIEFLKQICLEKGINTIFVLAADGNLPALGLYEKTGGKGFQVIEFDYHPE
jgi:aminoglycoside 3-N-acetyltransferase I